ncbi:Peroxin/Dysferlin domain-containing protein [Lentinula edodes]|nr:Peroxin/Dysferlin domain-containing protein [Lentinula edodes]
MPSSTTTSLHEFTSTVPFPLTAVLVQLAPYFALVKNAFEILTWSRSTSYDAWLALASWWAVCLLSNATLRYFLPIAVAISLTVITASANARSSAPPVTETNLQATIADLTTIQSLLPDATFLPKSRPAFSTLLRVSAILYPPYLLLTYYVPLRILVAVTGTMGITWNSPCASVLRNTLLKSAWVRWCTLYVWSKVTGQPLPLRSLSYQTLATLNAVEPGLSLRFLFTIYENQRWWMGLDFSPALLPGERPSWCSVSLQPVSPPNAFVLPEPTSVYLRDSNGKRVKRTATWKWEEPEWRVLVRKEDGVVSRVEKPVPAPKEENSSLIMKAAGKMKDVNSLQSPVNGEGDRPSSEKDEDESEDEDIPTDVDGWVYGDNKWEARSSKGGMGKYTRYRRWTRVAVVNEVVEIVEDGETGVEGGRTTVTMVNASPISSPSRQTEANSETESPLRQRLKSALSKGVS